MINFIKIIALIYISITGLFLFPLVFIFYGLDRANKFMEDLMSVFMNL